MKKRLVCFVSILLLLCVKSSATPPTERDASYTQLKSAKVSGEASTVTQLTLQREAATFLFKSGDFYFLEPVMGKVPGAVFIGDGEFTMKPPLDIEQRNLVILAGDPAMAEPFTELV